MPDAAGRFEAKLFPATYRMDLVVGDLAATTGQSIHSSDEVLVPAGGTVKQDFHFVHQVVKVRVLQSDEKTPVPNTHCLVSPYRTAMTDDAGWFILDPAPFGKLQMRVGGFRSFRMIDVPEAKKGSVFQLAFEPKSRK